MIHPELLETVTHHCIDDSFDLDQLPAQDQAMESFRKLFPLPLISAHVDEDGKRMIYKLAGSRMMENYIQKAEEVIKANRLPLAVSRNLVGDRAIVFVDNLVITYAPQNRHN